MTTIPEVQIQKMNTHTQLSVNKTQKRNSTARITRENMIYSSCLFLSPMLHVASNFTTARMAVRVILLDAAAPPPPPAAVDTATVAIVEVVLVAACVTAETIVLETADIGARTSTRAVGDANGIAYRTWGERDAARFLLNPNIVLPSEEDN